MTSLLAGQSTLYGSSRSPFARRVRLALLSRSIPFQWKELSLSEIFPPSPELLRVNPMGLIPAFESST
ncbi:MAG: Glutathione S-transferase, N-terminal domain, partial [Pseudomonadota bacterium]